MNTASKRTLHVIEQIVKSVPIGTNLALLQLIWAMINGSFLTARGAVHTALSISGFNDQAIRRSWEALRHGVWRIEELIERFHSLVAEEGSWQVTEYQGYRPLAVDISAIWRPRLQKWVGKIYHQLVGKSCVGIGFGLIAQVGTVDGHRLPLLRAIVHGLTTDSEDMLKERTLKEAVRLMSANEVLIHDGGVTMAEMHRANVPRFLIRLGTNCTARRNYLPTYKGRGPHPKRGELVRPLARVFKGKRLAATPPDSTVTFKFNGRQVTAQGWLHVMRADLKVADKHQLFSIWVIDDPLYDGVLVLGTNLPSSVTPRSLYRLYLDRWPIEQIPLVAKSLLGCHRQFVYAPTSCWRLGELAFFVGNLLTWLAATGSAFPAGYWDRHPKKRPVVSEGSWQALIFQKNLFLRGEFEKNVLSLPIYQGELRPIVAPKTVSRYFPLFLGPYC
jgi:hypothetical protein